MRRRRGHRLLLLLRGLLLGLRLRFGLPFGFLVALAFASNAWERFPRALSSLDAMSFHVSTVVFASSLRAWPISLSNVAFAARVASSDGFASVDAFTALSNASRHFLLASVNGLALTSRSTLPASVRVRFVALSALVESRSDSLMDRPARLDRMSLPFDATRSRSVSTSLSSTPALSASPTVFFALPLHAASWLMELARAHRRFSP